MRARTIGAIAVVVVALVGAGAYVYARYELESRIRSFGSAIDRIGYARGGRIPTQDEFTADVRAKAEELGLEVLALEVTRSEERGLDATGGAMQDRMGGLGQLRMQLVRYRVDARVVARKWLFSRTGNIGVDQTYRQEVTLETPNARPPPAADDEPVEPRGL